MTAAFIVVLACVVSLAGSAGAQDGASTVTVNLETCTLVGGVPTTSIGTTKEDANGVGRDCVAGYPADSAAAITIDGQGPTSVSESVLVWTDIADGEHVADTGDTTAGDDAVTFTVAGEDVDLWATYFEIEQPEDPEETQAAVDTQPTETTTSDEDDEDATDVPGAGTGAGDDTADSDEMDAVSLPNTGSGDTTVNMALIGGAAVVIALLLLVGVGVARSVRR
jgi:LPXTG-motif cell wall-anchored protein